MIIFKTGKLSKKEEKLVRSILSEKTDPFRDFYITKNNLRLFIKDNIDILFNNLKKGDKLVFSEKDGIAFITGWSDNEERKYLKILATNELAAERLLRVLSWNVNCTIWAKVKKNNFLNSVLQRKGFKWFGDRGVEVLLVREPREEENDNNSNGKN